MDIIQAERTAVRFFDGLSVDGYMLPSGEFRVSISGASVLLGYNKNWLGRVMSRSGNAVKTLQELGFSAQIQQLVTRSIKGGGDTVQSISLRDLNVLTLYAASEKKPQALAIQLALTDMALTDFFRDAFGLSALSIDEKRDQFYAAFAATLTAADWLEWDRADVALIEEGLVMLGEMG